MASICFSPNLIFSNLAILSAHYGGNLIASSFKVYVLNPIKTSPLHKSNVRKAKADKVYTYLIAKTFLLQSSYKFFAFYDLNPMEDFK